MSTANCQLPTANSGTEELPVVVYSPESPLAHPLKLIREICTDLWRCRELTWILFKRDTKAQHRQSVLGFLWMFIPVIAPTIVWTFLSSTRVMRVAETPIPYPIYVLVGTLIWGLFISALNQPLASFNEGRAVFMKLKVPPEAFILAGMLKIFTDVAIRLLVLIPVFLIFRVIPASTCWLFTLALLATGVVGMALGMFMMALGSLYEDVPRMMGTAASLGMYATPVLYPPPTSGFAMTVVNWNPMTAMVMVTRDSLTVGHSLYLTPFLVITGISIVLLFISLINFRVVLPRLVERMGM